MRELSRTDAPALRALACLCLSDPSNPVNPGYGVTTEDVGKFWLDKSWEAVVSARIALVNLRDAGYVREHKARVAPGYHGPTTWTPTARGWQAALMPNETVDQRA